MTCKYFAHSMGRGLSGMRLSACSQDDMSACMRCSQVMPEGSRSASYTASNGTVKLVTLATEQTLTAGVGFGLMHNKWHVSQHQHGALTEQPPYASPTSSVLLLYSVCHHVVHSLLAGSLWLVAIGLRQTWGPHSSVRTGDLSLNNSQSCSRAGTPTQKVITTSSSGSSRCPASSRCSSLISSCFRRICRRWMGSCCSLHCIWFGLFNQSSVHSALAAIVCSTL